jgi:aryl-alcohol dehydrogenase-like predicted oxidoreductase
MAKIGSTDLDIFPLALGGNVFGWTANEKQSFAVLDGYKAAGGNFIDTADVYSAWAPGNSGGESETIIGRWLAARGKREQTIVATKVGMHHKYEGELAKVVARERLSSIPYFALASGFLTGKYRPGSKVESQRAQSAGAYLNEKGIRVLAALDEIAASHGVALATVALAWLAAQPTVVAPIASARTTDQLPDLLRISDLRLTDTELRELNEASAPSGTNGTEP